MPSPFPGMAPYLEAPDKRRRDLSRKAARRTWPKYLLGAGAAGLALLVITFRVLAPQPTTFLSPTLAGRTTAIVDQVALSEPNPEFTETAAAYLTKAGFAVDIHEGEDITVEFFRTLPTRGYDLILFRTHSTNDFLDAELAGDPVYLYTGERHNRNRYTYQQLTRQLMAGRVLYEEDAPALFVVGPRFVRESMKGRFENTLLVIGGCDSLSTTELADAFLERGASAVVGWDGLVDLDHNDRALLHILRLLTVEGLPLERAVSGTMAEVGPDPTFGSVAGYYPTESRWSIHLSHDNASQQRMVGRDRKEAMIWRSPGYSAMIQESRPVWTTQRFPCTTSWRKVLAGTPHCRPLSFSIPG